MQWNKTNQQKILDSLNGVPTRWEKFWASSLGLFVFSLGAAAIFVIALTQK